MGTTLQLGSIRGHPPTHMPPPTCQDWGALWQRSVPPLDRPPPGGKLPIAAVSSPAAGSRAGGLPAHHVLSCFGVQVRWTG